MKQLSILLSLCVFANCYNKIQEIPPYNPNKAINLALDATDSEAYEVIKPAGEQKGVLILFPGFSETPANIKREFKIVQPALKKGIALVLMKFNRRLWLNTQEKFRLASTFNQLFAKYDLYSTNIFIGGFSSGGNLSLLLANHLAETDNLIQPKGVFSIDSPVDLLGLYKTAQRNIQHNFSPISVQESIGIIQRFDQDFGTPEDSLENYEMAAVYTKKTNNTHNLTHLDKVKIRLYTEPDIQWWKANRQNEYEDMNAYFIKHLADELIKKYGNQVEYIPTQNKGFRANGQRHPHSWSIVDIDKLLTWMLIK